MNKNFYFPNHNPYLLWAKQINWANYFQVKRRIGTHERLRATYNDVKPYTVEQLSKPPSHEFQTNKFSFAGLPSSYTSTREVLSALADAEAGSTYRSDRLDAIELARHAYWATGLEKAIEQVKELFGAAVTIDYYSDEILFTVNLSKL